MKTFGQYIRELREAKSFSLREFARKLDCSAAFISDVELGRRNPSDEVMAGMSRILGISIEDLQQYDTRPPIEELRRRSESDATYAFALRRIARHEVSGDDLLKVLKKLDQQKAKDPK